MEYHLGSALHANNAQQKSCPFGQPSFIYTSSLLFTHKAAQFLNGFGFNLADTLGGNAVFGSQFV